MSSYQVRLGTGRTNFSLILIEAKVISLYYTCVRHRSAIRVVELHNVEGPVVAELAVRVGLPGYQAGKVTDCPDRKEPTQSRHSAILR